MSGQATESRWLVTFTEPPYVFVGFARDAAAAISDAAATLDLPGLRAEVTFTVQDYPKS